MSENVNEINNSIPSKPTQAENKPKRLNKKSLIILAAIAVFAIIGICLIPKKEKARTVVTENRTKVYVEELNYFDGKDVIMGRIYKPEDSVGKKPLIIYCHGLGSTYYGSEKLCRMTASKGYVTYAFDFRGGSPKSKSSGNHLDMTVESEVKDLLTVADRLRDEDFVDKRQIYLMGHSQGGLVAALGAHKIKGVKGLILLAPAFNIPEFCSLTYPKNRDIPDSVDFGGIMYVGKNYIRQNKNLDPFDKLKKFDGDVLLIHGAADKLVPCEYAARAAHEYKKPDLQILDGIGHSFNGADGNKAFALIEKYLDAHYKER